MFQKLFENFSAVQKRMEAACSKCRRDPKEVVLVAVTKGVELGVIIEAHRLGLSDFGENKIQEAALKMPQAPKAIAWHFIGHLQTNKAVKALELGFKTIQSLDSVSLATKLNNLAAQRNIIQKVLLEVNIAQEPDKYGFSVDGVRGAAGELRNLAHLKVAGLMCMGPQAGDAEIMRPYFKKARELAGEIGNIFGEKQILSMGMSQDFEVAIEEGATMVRLGSVLFCP